MKIPFDLECRKCKKNFAKTINLNDSSLEYDCRSCGYNSYVALGNTYTIGSKVLIKSHHEYSVNKDYTMSVLLSAMALEADVAHWFLKWRALELEKIEDSASSNYDIEEIKSKAEKEYIKLMGSLNKIEHASKLMYPDGLDVYVKNYRTITDDITNNYKMLDVNNLTKSIYEKLFIPRNQIVHIACSKYNEQKAKECIDISDLGIYLFQELDKYKSENR